MEEAKDAVKREAEKKKKSALQKLFQKKRYQKQYRQPDRVKSKGCSDHFRTEVYGKSERCRQDGGGTEPGDFCHGSCLCSDLCADRSQFYQLYGIFARELLQQSSLPAIPVRMKIFMPLKMRTVPWKKH